MDWKTIQENYSHHVGTYKNLKDEFLWLDYEYHFDEKDIDENWNSKSSKDKQLERIYRSKSSKKTEGFKLGLFAYEESILDLIEALFVTLNCLEKTKRKNFQIIRLIAHLSVEHKNLNRFRDSRKISSLYYDKMKYIIYECLNSELETFFIKKTNLLYFESKLEIAQLNFKNTTLINNVSKS
ncbi:MULTISPECIES: hypothetical protein [unclassified Chryseobacterium]|uniref:hypothetical protein n=1 Tax=unclassified Chryseobacterium TaxID=2593645 RepID=UPI00100A5829|nr:MULTISPECIES: hypothetical protein [unclassified Chryseobacterium]RXM53211.1 hypothetical protein BOQ64_02175 [Chryseobacterium sp. CH25]RXM65594.1 hypothetical protein BOQ60_07320 [Chryseobacterium sp. CH1]